jgi:hypothetical protein
MSVKILCFFWQPIDDNIQKIVKSKDSLKKAIKKDGYLKNKQNKEQCAKMPEKK